MDKNGIATSSSPAADPSGSGEHSQEISRYARDRAKFAISHRHDTDTARQESRAGAIELHEDISDVAILVRAMLQYCYTSTCPIVANPQIHPILFRIRMFALGEKYFVQGLCEVSSHGLDLMLKATSNSIPLTSDTFLQAIREAYTLIKDPQRHVRDILITHVVNSSRRTQITRGSQYRDLMQELPDFAIDLTMALVEKSIPHTEVTTRLSPPQMLLILQPHNWEDLVDPHILSGPCRYNCPDGCGDVFTASMGGSSSGNWHHSCQVMDTFHHMSFQRWAEEFLVDEGT